MDPPVIHSPKRTDLLQMMPDLPEITAKSPNLIYSAPVLHTSAGDDNCIESSEEIEIKNELIPPKYKILPMRTRKTPKITLVLDLDETLVHSELAPMNHSDHMFKIRVNQDVYNIYVAYRPGLQSFLKSVSENFELVIFTASMKPYAEQVIKALDPSSYRLRYKFYRDSCVQIQGNYVKDLRLLGRDLRHVIIVDNSELAFSCQPQNGILISSWFNDQNDRELEKVYMLLEKLRYADDVREALNPSYRT